MKEKHGWERAADGVERERPKAWQGHGHVVVDGNAGNGKRDIQGCPTDNRRDSKSMSRLAMETYRRDPVDNEP